MNRKTPIVSLALCMALTAVVRIIWMTQVMSFRPLDDEKLYVSLGRSLAAGHGYRNGTLTAYFPPGYPMYLAAFFRVAGPSLIVAHVAMITTMVLTIPVTYWLALLLFRSERIALVTAVVMALYPTSIAYSSTELSEPLLTLLLLLGCALAIKAQSNGVRLALLSGLVFGLACLVKPQVIIVPVALWGPWLFTRNGQTRKRCLLYCATTYLILLGTLVPWEVRTIQLFHTPVFVATTGGINLFAGNNPYADGNGLSETASNLLPRCTANEAVCDEVAMRLGIRYIISHPWQTISLWPRKLSYLFGLEYDGYWWPRDGMTTVQERKAAPWLAICTLCGIFVYLTVLVLFLCFILAALLARSYPLINAGPLPLTAVWFIGSLCLVYCLYFAQSRYHIPFVPWMVMSGVAGLGALKQRYLGQRHHGK